MKDRALGGVWIKLKKDTDCAQCHFTIRKKDPEGMLVIDSEYFCTQACAEQRLLEKRRKEQDG